MALKSKTKQVQVSQQDKARLQKMLEQSQRKALQMEQEQATRSAQSPQNWQQLSQQDREAIMLKALEMTLYNKPLSPAIKQTIPPQVAQALAETVKDLDKHRLLGTRSLPQRLQVIVDRLRNKGLLDKPAKPDSPLDRLDPAQRKRQLAAEALELRRQNAIQMVEANKLLPKRT